MLKKLLSVIMVVAMCLSVVVNTSATDEAMAKITYIKLPLDYITASSTEVKLQFKTKTDATGKIKVYKANNWDGTAITGDNHPGYARMSIGEINVTGMGAYEIDVKDAIFDSIADGFVTFALVTYDNIDILLTEEATAGKYSYNLDVSNIQITDSWISKAYTAEEEAVWDPNYIIATEGLNNQYQYPKIAENIGGRTNKVLGLSTAQSEARGWKFFNVLKDSALDSNDVGRIMDISFDIYSTFTLGNVTMYAMVQPLSSIRYSTLGYEQGYEKNEFVRYNIPLTTTPEWKHFNISHVIDSGSVTNQYGPFTISAPKASAVTGGTSYYYYIDNFKSIDITDAPKLEYKNTVAGKTGSDISRYHKASADATISTLQSPPEPMYGCNFSFDDYNDTTFRIMESKHLDSSREVNFIYSNGYTGFKDGVQNPNVTLSSEFDHTTGTGKSVKIASAWASWNNRWNMGRLKLFNSFKDSPLTSDDIGKTFNISFWLYSPTDTIATSGIMSVYNTSTMTGTNGWGGTYYKGTNAIQYYEFPIAANTWTKCEYRYTLDATNVNDVYQVGMLVIAVASDTVTPSTGTGPVLYLDDVNVSLEDHELKTLGEFSPESPFYCERALYNSTSKSINAVMVIAAYDVNDKLVSVSIGDSKTIPASYDEVVSAGYESLPKNISYAKVFVWDGVENMTPYYDATEIDY